MVGQFGFGFGRCRRARGGGFSPSMLFSGGVVGGWYDPSDLSTLFQDSAGTTPVTADGDPVGKILDKSGNGNHLIQATSTKRPLYKTSGGLRWLLFDGVDDYLSKAAVALTDGSGFHSAGAAINPTGVAGNQHILNADQGTRVAQLITLVATAPTAVDFNTGPAGFTDTCAAVTAAADTVLTQLSNANVEIFKDGAGNGSVAVTGTRQTGATTLYMGSVDGASWFFGGKLYGAIEVGKTLSAADHAKLVTYLGSKQGRTI